MYFDPIFAPDEKSNAYKAYKETGLQRRRSVTQQYVQNTLQAFLKWKAFFCLIF